MVQNRLTKSFKMALDESSDPPTQAHCDAGSGQTVSEHRKSEANMSIEEPQAPVSSAHTPSDESIAAPASSNSGTPQTRSPRRMWKRGLFLISAIVVIGSAAAWIAGGTSPHDAGPKMTYSIKRGDLVVIVTEQGVLESSNNTEIKCKVRGSSTVTWVIESGTIVKPGDELVRLDTKVIEEQVSLQKTNVFEATATLEETLADVAAAEIAIDAYLQGRYRSRMKAKEAAMAIAASNLRSAEKMLEHSELLFKRGYVTELELEGNKFTVTQADLEFKVTQTEIAVLKKYTKAMELESLNGTLTSKKSKLEADRAGLSMDQSRRDRALEELVNCVVRAEKPGLVIYPTAAAWKEQPDITEGGRVVKDQVLLIMPELLKMQIKVGIHESIIDRIKPDLVAHIALPEMTLQDKVSSVAAVTRPAGWWTGNVVKYDTIIQLPEVEGLKPGMSAEVRVIIAEHKDVLKIPVAAVVETEKGDFFCWVKSDNGSKKRPLILGDSNDVFIVVKQGVTEGDEVILNPLSIVEEAQAEAKQALGESTSSKPE